VESFVKKHCFVADCIAVAPMQMNTIPTGVGVGSSGGTLSKKKDKKKGKKQPLTKNDIGAPTNFQFVVSLLF